MALASSYIHEPDCYASVPTDVAEAFEALRTRLRVYRHIQRLPLFDESGQPYEPRTSIPRGEAFLFFAEDGTGRWLFLGHWLAGFPLEGRAVQAFRYDPGSPDDAPRYELAAKFRCPETYVYPKGLEPTPGEN